MPPRRAPSVPSVASRAPSPVVEEDDVSFSILTDALNSTALLQTPFFDSVDELQQHVRHYYLPRCICLTDYIAGYQRAGYTQAQSDCA